MLLYCFLPLIRLNKESQWLISSLNYLEKFYFLFRRQSSFAQLLLLKNDKLFGGNSCGILLGSNFWHVMSSLLHLMISSNVTIMTFECFYHDVDNYLFWIVCWINLVFQFLFEQHGEEQKMFMGFSCHTKSYVTFLLSLHAAGSPVVNSEVHTVN